MNKPKKAFCLAASWQKTWSKHAGSPPAHRRNSSHPAFSEMAVGLHRCSEAAASFSSRSSPIIVCAVLFLITVVRACRAEGPRRRLARRGQRPAWQQALRHGLRQWALPWNFQCPGKPCRWARHCLPD